jgi:hypothetical protein
MYPFDWYQYVLGILGGWMAGVYGGFTSSAELLMEPRGFHPISYCLRIP